MAWHKDPYALGALSVTDFQTMGTDRYNLGAPVAGRVFFAGEATGLNMGTASTNGAFGSGIREAKRIMQAKEVVIRTRSRGSSPT